MNNIFNLVREGKNGTTSLGIIKGYNIPKKSIEIIRIIPYGKQIIENINAINRKPALIFSDGYYSVNLYKQRNDSYILKYKLTEIVK